MIFKVGLRTLDTILGKFAALSSDKSITDRVDELKDHFSDDISKNEFLQEVLLML